MSEEEIRGQKAALLLEHQEAKASLAHLHEKAIRNGRDIQDFGRLLEYDASRKLYDQRQENHGVDVRVIDPKFKAALDYEMAMQLADEIRAAMAKLSDLEARKARLGL